MGIQFKKRLHTKSIIIHDSHTDPSVEHAVNVLRWQGRKMGLLEIGYHFVIDRDGLTEETRPRALVGQHCRGHDLTSIGICLIGGSDKLGQPEDNFTQEQRTSLFELVRTMKKQYDGPSLMGHTEAVHGRLHHLHGHDDRQCPTLDMTDLRADYWTYIQMGGRIA